MIGGSRVLPVLIQRLIGPLAGESRRFHVVANGPNKGLAELGALVDSGRLAPHIDSTCQLSEVPEALRYFGQGRHAGKIAITVKR